MRKALPFLLFFGCAPSFVVRDDYVPSQQHCSLIERTTDQLFCHRCFADNGVWQYRRETLMTGPGWGCEQFFSERFECVLLADPEVSEACFDCVLAGGYYRSNEQRCQTN